MAEPLSFLDRPVLTVAPRLLGARLSHGGVTVRITEVEAYDGASDPGSHSYRGPTRRNAAMFGPSGHLYAYFIYGMHTNVNVVCGPQGQAAGVLLRAGAVIEGLETARSRRPRSTERDLARGPGRLASAMGFTLADDGMDLAGVLLPRGRALPRRLIEQGPRVGLRRAADRPWRFWIAGDPSVAAAICAIPAPRPTPGEIAVADAPATPGPAPPAAALPGERLGARTRSPVPACLS